ncbi:MAG: LysR substrate-binding domain-containing protein [Alistipes sp.]
MEFRLMAFISVARNLNFTKAARELHISQPAVSKHIQELETLLGMQLFERVGNRVLLTAAGNVCLKYAESIIDSYRRMQLEMNLMSGKFNGELRIGASTTIAQYVLPPIIAKFITRFPDVKLSMLTGNSEQIEQAIDDHKIDVGMVEGSRHRQGLRYVLFANDELVMVTSTTNRSKDEVSVDELVALPLVLREAGSGTLEVIENALADHKLSLKQMNILLQMGATEGIKYFLSNAPSAYAIISIAALSKELINNTLKVIEINGLEFCREFSFVLAQGVHNELTERFMEFVKAFDNKKL